LIFELFFYRFALARFWLTNDSIRDILNPGSVTEIPPGIPFPVTLSSVFMGDILGNFGEIFFFS
jgi:hypothetical protein